MAYIVPAAALIIPILTATQSIISHISEDDPKREHFTKEFVKRAKEEFPEYNVVIIHPKHNREGIWIHQHHELPISFGRTIGYEVYFSKKGDPFSLTNLGDGGYINWAYSGYKREGKHLST